MRILVTGVSGFVGSMLAPRLLADGHHVRALSRDPARTAPTPAVDLVRGDVLTGEGLERALDGVEVAYYLIHSMESASPRRASEQAFPARDQAFPAHEWSFPTRERIGATNFAAAAQRAGVRRIVYLGGLVPHEPAVTSAHLASRVAVEDVLLEAVPDSVALRSAIVIGARSRSFRLLVRLIERLPVLALPPWRRFRIQPIDARDAIEMLLAASRAPGVAGRSLDIGGPEALTYGELLQRIAGLLLLHRPTFAIAIGATPLTARLAAALGGEDPELILALMDGLQSDLLPADDRAAELLGVRLHSLDAAVECALREWEAVEPLAAR
jgi:uncharacterized protein YbjT (DUF2867 family)